MAVEFRDVSDEQIAAYAKTFTDGGTLRELKGISNAELEAIYASGLEYYKAGDFESARKLFSFLTYLEHTNSRYWTSHGASLQALKMYDKAIKCYQFGAFLDIRNPKPPYYAAECFYRLKDYENARKALNMLREYAPKDTEAGRQFLAKGEELRAKIEAA